VYTTGHHDGGPDDDFLRRMSAPENEIPVAMPLNRLLARSDHAAMAVLGLQVFTTGLSFDLTVRCRPSLVEVLGRDVGDLLWGRRGEGRLLLGVEFADGRRVTSLRDRDDLDVVLQQGGGSGSQLSADQSWWLNPLPPDGPVRVVARCTELGPAEASVEFDGTAIRRAAADVVTLWPWVPPQPHVPPEEPRRSDLPADSWFARGT
jgi:hypothetical protein